MIKTFPKQDDHRQPVVRISEPAMSWRDVDLGPLLACARRELARRQFVFKKKVLEGSISEEKAEVEIEGMREIVEFLVHCVFVAVTRRAREFGASVSK